jgi:hypothetical protein
MPMEDVIALPNQLLHEGIDGFFNSEGKCKIFVGKRKEKIKKRVQRTCTPSHNML